VTLVQRSMFPEALAEDRGVSWRLATAVEVNPLLTEKHYLGPVAPGRVRYVFAGFATEDIVAAQVWGYPTARNLPSDGTWLELQRWCLTPEAGANGGSRMHRYVVRWLRQRDALVTTLVSYSDPEQGHDGALYRASNWMWAPTWHRLRPPPTGNGSWAANEQGVKDRWVFFLRPDARRPEVLAIDDSAAVRRMS